jgi:hypothetical protein
MSDAESDTVHHPIVTFQGLHERVTTLEERLDHIIARLDTAEQKISL